MTEELRQTILSIGSLSGVLSTVGLIFAWLRGGFKKQFDSEDALKNISELQMKTAALERLESRVLALEKDNLEIKRNVNDQFQQIMVKMDDNNKLLMELMFKVGELTGRSK